MNKEITLNFTSEIYKQLEGMSDGDQVFVLYPSGRIDLVPVPTLVFCWDQNCYYHVWNFNDEKTEGDISKVVAVARHPSVEFIIRSAPTPESKES